MYLKQTEEGSNDMVQEKKISKKKICSVECTPRILGEFYRVVIISYMKCTVVIFSYEMY